LKSSDRTPKFRKIEIIETPIENRILKGPSHPKPTDEDLDQLKKEREVSESHVKLSLNNINIGIEFGLRVIF
jgi:hypothetical protein